AKITVILEFSGGPPEPKTFSITKKEPDETKPTVLAFNVNPYMVWPDSKAEVSWNVFGKNLSLEDLFLATPGNAREVLTAFKGKKRIGSPPWVRLLFINRKTGVESVLAELELTKVTDFPHLKPE